MYTQDWWTGVTGKVKRSIVPSSSKSRSSKHRSSRHSRHSDSRRSSVRLPGVNSNSGYQSQQSRDGDEDGANSNIRSAQHGYGGDIRSGGEATEGSVDGYDTDPSFPYQSMQRTGDATTSVDEDGNSQSQRVTEYAPVRSNGAVPGAESGGGSNSGYTNGALTNGKRQIRAEAVARGGHKGANGVSATGQTVPVSPLGVGTRRAWVVAVRPAPLTQRQ
jgi:hypothetical protein